MKRPMPYGKRSTRNIRSDFLQPLIRTVIAFSSKRQAFCWRLSLVLLALVKEPSTALPSSSSDSGLNPYQAESGGADRLSRSSRRYSDSARLRIDCQANLQTQLTSQRLSRF